MNANISWPVLRAELVGTAALVLVGLSLVILMFGDGSPIPGALPSEGWRRLITGFLFGTHRCVDRALPGRGTKRRAHQPHRDAGVPLDGQARSADVPRLCRGAACWGHSRERAAPGLGRDGAKRVVRRHRAGRSVQRRHRPARGSDHDVRDGHPAVRVPRLPPDSSFTPAIFRFCTPSWCTRSRRSRERAPTRRAAWTGGHLRTLGGLVDLLDRAGDRKCRGRASRAVRSRNGSRSQSCITSTATATGCFARPEASTRSGSRKLRALEPESGQHALECGWA